VELFQRRHLAINSAWSGRGDGFQELTDIEHAAQRCAELTHGLLTFSHRTAGRTQTLHINQLITEADRLLQRVLPASINIELQTAPDLWIVNDDNTQLHQLLMNLSVNARDAMPQGGTLTLRTANRVLSPGDCGHNVEARPGEFVELTVRDNGIRHDLRGPQPDL
jgi:two-component system cell cycle sensor histidine kinase/response regulator CckA